MEFKDINVSSLIMMMLMVIIIILLIAIISKTYQAKEKFGSLQRRRILSKASLFNSNTDETNHELVSENESLNQELTPENESLNQELQKKEGYVMSRNNMLFQGQFDHLINGKKDKPSFRQADKSIVEEIGDAVKEKVQAIAEQTSDSNIAVDSSIPTELQPVVEEEQKPTEDDYSTEKIKETEAGIVNNDEVVSNSGNAIESSIPESFGYQRLNNNFSVLQQAPTASKIAQTEDPANQQQSTDMLAFIKNMVKNE
jgi:hypothetical protein